MTVTISERGNRIAVAAIAGRLDLLTAAEVKKRLQATVATGHHCLVVDLHEVPFIDSSGLGALIGALKASRVAGGDLRIARPGMQVRSVLEISLLDRVLLTYATVEEALARYE